MQAVGNLDTKKHMVIILRNFVGTFPLYDNTHGSIEHVGIAAEFDMDATDSQSHVTKTTVCGKRMAHGRKLSYVFKRIKRHIAGPSNRDVSLQLDLLGEFKV